MFIKVSVYVGGSRDYFRVHNFDNKITFSDILTKIGGRKDGWKDTDGVWSAALSNDGTTDSEDAPEIAFDYPLQAAHETGYKHIVYSLAPSEGQSPAGTSAAVTKVAVHWDGVHCHVPTKADFDHAFRQLRSRLADYHLTKQLPSTCEITGQFYSGVATPSECSQAAMEAGLVCLRVVNGSSEAMKEAAESQEAAPVDVVVLLGPAVQHSAQRLLDKGIAHVIVVAAGGGDDAASTPTAPQGVPRIPWDEIVPASLAAAAKTAAEKPAAAPPAAVAAEPSPVLFRDDTDLDTDVFRRTQTTSFTASSLTAADLLSEDMPRASTTTLAYGGILDDDFLPSLPQSNSTGATASAVAAAAAATAATDSAGLEVLTRGWIFPDAAALAGGPMSLVDQATWSNSDFDRCHTSVGGTETNARSFLPRCHTSPAADSTAAEKESKGGLGFLKSLPKKNSLTNVPGAALAKLAAWARGAEGSTEEEGTAAAEEAVSTLTASVDRLVAQVSPATMVLDEQSTSILAYKHFLAVHAEPLLHHVGTSAAPRTEAVARCVDAFATQHDKMLSLLSATRAGPCLALQMDHPQDVALHHNPAANAQLAEVQRTLTALRGETCGAEGGLPKDVRLIANLADAREVVKALLEDHKGIGTLNIVSNGSVDACVYYPELARELGTSLAELHKLRNLTVQVRKKRIMDVINTSFKTKCASGPPAAYYAVAALTENMLLSGPADLLTRLREDAVNVINCLLSTPGHPVTAALELVLATGDALDQDPACIIALNGIMQRLSDLQQQGELTALQQWNLGRARLLRGVGWCTLQTEQADGARVRFDLSKILQVLLMKADAEMLVRTLLHERYTDALADSRLDLNRVSFPAAKCMLRDLTQLSYELDPPLEDKITGKQKDPVSPDLVNYLTQQAHSVPPHLAVQPVSMPLPMSFPVGAMGGVGGMGGGLGGIFGGLGGLGGLGGVGLGLPFQQADIAAAAAAMKMSQGWAASGGGGGGAGMPGMPNPFATPTP
eukprot:Rhum_TRINITY_DN14611_c18_g1::Rhum_TRINITY_DN14611_c18_g1_i1::g.103447::m.103447